MNSVIEQAEKARKGIVAMKVMAGGLRRIQRTDPNYAQADPRRRDGVGPEVGSQQSPRPHHHPEHDRYGPVGREPQGHGRPVRRYRPQTARAPDAANRLVLLPHVRRLRRPMPPGTAGRRRASLPHLCRWLRTVRSRPRAFPRTRRRACRRQVRRLSRLHGAMPVRRQCYGPV